jgi:hypothetical protein
MSAERIGAICTLEVPLAKYHLCSLWGMAGFCWIWISTFGVTPKPLYAATNGQDNESLKWPGETNHAYKTLKKSFIQFQN